MTEKEKDKFIKIEEKLEMLIEHCRETGLIICDYKGGISIPRKISDLISKLQELDQVKDDVANVFVPIEIFSKIDAAQNPQLYTRECVLKALDKNEEVRGQLDSLSRFRQLLMKDLSDTFPVEMNKYRHYKRDTSMTSSSAAELASPSSSSVVAAPSSSLASTGLVASSALPPPVIPVVATATGGGVSAAAIQPMDATGECLGALSSHPPPGTLISASPSHLAAAAAAAGNTPVGSNLFPPSSSLPIPAPPGTQFMLPNSGAAPQPILPPANQQQAMQQPHHHQLHHHPHHHHHHHPSSTSMTASMHPNAVLQSASPSTAASTSSSATTNKPI